MRRYKRGLGTGRPESGFLEEPLGPNGTLVMLFGIPDRGIFLEQGKQFLKRAGNEVELLPFGAPFHIASGYGFALSDWFIGGLRIHVDHLY